MDAIIAGPLITAGIVFLSSKEEEWGVANLDSGDKSQGVGSIARRLEEKIGGKISEFTSRAYSFDAPKMLAFHKGGVRYSYPAGVAVTDHEKHLKGSFTHHPLSGIWAHELIHSKFNDAVWMRVVPIIISIAVTALGLPFIQVDLLAICSLVAGVVSFVAYSRFAEWRADREACKYLTESEKHAYVKWMKNVRNDRIQQRNEGGFFQRLSINADGDYRFNLFAPSLSSRIKLITTTIKPPSVEVPRRLLDPALNDDPIRTCTGLNLAQIKKYVLWMEGILGDRIKYRNDPNVAASERQKRQSEIKENGDLVNGVSLKERIEQINKRLLSTFAPSSEIQYVGNINDD